jgi:uncharacterized protein (TIGR02145 family)
MKESGSMKTMKKLFAMAFAAVVGCACCQQELIDPNAVENDTLKVYATIEGTDDTKTSLNEKEVYWTSGDRIAVFMNKTLRKRFEVSSESVGTKEGTFLYDSDYIVTGKSVAISNNVAYYPFSEVNCAVSGGTYTLSNVTLPSTQNYASASFGQGAFPMVAVTANTDDSDFAFKNLCGVLALQLKGSGSVKSITVKGNSNEILSGKATVTASYGKTPEISLLSDGSKTVTLDCGESGVELQSNTPTTFFIALPPVSFDKGFTVTVTDADGKTYTVGTDKTNTVLRSSLLVMPALNLETSIGGDTDNDDEIVPVSKVTINERSLTLTTGFSYTLTAKITPIDATDQRVVWRSDNTSVVTVDQSGVLTTLSSGNAVISAEAGGVVGTCMITVIAPTTREVKDYKVDGVSYGKGIVIGDVIWAPVNCGYEPATSDSKGYPYGKLYQWGRKYGQGYSKRYDASVPEKVAGPISSINGQKDKYANTFFMASESPYDWTDPQDDNLWNSGAEESPIKTEYDPCPDGWRVPTYAELGKLAENSSSWITVGGQEGYYFCGDYTYLNDLHAPQVFFPAAGIRKYDGDDAIYRGSCGYYWSSRPRSYYCRAYALYIAPAFSSRSDEERAHGYSVRCVQE